MRPTARGSWDSTTRTRCRRWGGRKKATAASDHWHRTADDVGRPYKFIDAETLLDNFFDEVERILTELDVPLQVVADKGKGAR
jgi:hypothetical protein